MFSENFAELEFIQQKCEKPIGYLIFLHGLGKTGKWQKDQFIELMGENVKFPQIKIIFPTSVSREEEKRGVVPSWFNITADRTKNPVEIVVNHEHINECIKYLDYLIQSVVKTGVPVDRIFIGGVSQGAFLSLIYSYTKEINLKGVISLSGLFLKDYEKKFRNDANLPPVFFANFTEDPVVLFSLATEGRQFLAGKHVQCETLNIPGKGHEINEEMLKTTYEWINKVFAKCVM